MTFEERRMMSTRGN